MVHDHFALRGPAVAPSGRQPAAPAALTRWDRALECRSADDGCIDWFGIDPELVEGCRLEDLLAQRNLSLLPLAQRALGGEAQAALHSFRVGSRCRTGVVVFVPAWHGSQVDGVLMHVFPEDAGA